MKRGLGAYGYTLLEVMIVLAISGGLLVSTMFLISGQQQRTQFSQAIKEIESQIQDVINDVATGYYANTGDFACDATTEGPRLTGSATDTQGENKDCVFLGRVMHFGVRDSENEQYNILNVIGLREHFSNGQYQQSQTLGDARPVAMAPGSQDDPASFPDTTDSRQLRFGLRILSMRVNGQPIGAVGFLGSLAPYGSTAGNLVSGAQTVELVAIPGTNLDMSPTDMVDAINSIGTVAVTKNPASGVVLCFQSGGTNEYGKITIGSNGRQLTTSLVITTESCA